MEFEIKKEVANFKSMNLVFSANIEGIPNINQLRNEIYFKMFNYNKFIICVKSHLGKVWGRFLPVKFEKATIKHAGK